MNNRWFSVVTDVGKEAMTRALSQNLKITVTRAKASDTAVNNEQAEQQKDVTNYIKDFNVISVKKDTDSKFNILLQMTSENVSQNFKIKQIGYFIKIGDETEEILWVIQQCNDDGDIILTQEQDNGTFVQEYSYTLEFSNNSSVEVIVNQDAFVSVNTLNTSIDYLKNLIDKNTIEATQNYIKFKNNIALLYGMGSHNSAADNSENGGKGKKIAFTNELSIKKVLCVQIERIAMDGIAGTFYPDLINEQVMLSTYDESGFYFYHNIINAKRFFWFAVVVIE